MRQSELKLRMAIQDTTENKVASRDGGIEREAEKVREIERRGTRSADGLQRMQKNGKIQGLNVGKNWFKQRVVEIAMVDVRTHVNAPDPGQFAGAVQFVDRAIREEHWKGQKSEQPGGIFQ